MFSARGQSIVCAWRKFELTNKSAKGNCDGKSEVQPYFSRRIKKTNEARELTQEKLADFWNTNRTRAIAIIKDDCTTRS